MIPKVADESSGSFLWTTLCRRSVDARFRASECSLFPVRGFEFFQ
jgi:hypothetical protein